MRPILTFSIINVQGGIGAFLYKIAYKNKKGGKKLPEEKKKSKYSQAQNKATQKYIKANYAEVKFRVKPEVKEKYQSAAEKADLSLSKFMQTAADEKIERDSLL